MSWHQIPRAERDELAKRLTQRRLDIYTLRVAGASWKAISEMTRLQQRTVRGHYDAAKITHDQIRHELREEAA